MPARKIMHACSTLLWQSDVRWHVTFHCVQAGVATNQPWKATAVQLLGLLLSAAKRSKSLAGCSSPFARHALQTTTAEPHD